jgi:hypothetical protein
MILVKRHAICPLVNCVLQFAWGFNGKRFSREINGGATAAVLIIYAANLRLVTFTALEASGIFHIQAGQLRM